MISGLGKVIVITQYMYYNAHVIDSYILTGRYSCSQQNWVVI